MPVAVPESIQPWLPLIRGGAIAASILIAGWIASKWVHRLARRGLAHRKLDEALGRFVAAILQYTVLAATIITALGAVGIQTTSLVAVFASAGLAVGLALQGSLGNFASGVMLLFFRPFTLNDRISAGGHSGVVHDIGLFATTLLTADNETILVPNSAVTAGSIVNYTTRGTLRGHIDIGIAFGTDVGKVLTVLTAAARRTELAHPEPAPAVAFSGIGPRSLQFTVFAWSAAGDQPAMLHNLRRAIYEDLAQAGIEVPVSQLVLAQAA